MCPASKVGSAIQYIHRKEDDYKECNIIGRYDDMRDDTHYKLLSESDPSLGVSITYLYGDKCRGNLVRSATIDLYCANVAVEIDSVQEPSKCQYHLSMKSYYGCPTVSASVVRNSKYLFIHFHLQDCPITSDGLCNSHGHCAYDSIQQASYCYCNEGFGGSDCSPMKASSTVSTAMSAEIYLLISLLVVAIALVGVVGVLVCFPH